MVASVWEVRGLASSSAWKEPGVFWGRWGQRCPSRLPGSAQCACAALVGAGDRGGSQAARRAAARCPRRFARGYAGAAASVPGAQQLAAGWHSPWRRARPFCLVLAPWQTPGPPAAGCHPPWVGRAGDSERCGRIRAGKVSGRRPAGPGGGLHWSLSRAEAGLDGRSRGA